MLRQCRTRRCRSWCPSYRKRAGDRRATRRVGNPWAGDPQGLAAVGKSESGSYRRDLSWVPWGASVGMKPSGRKLYWLPPLGHHHCSPAHQNNWSVPHSLGIGVGMPLLGGEPSAPSFPFSWRFPKKGAGETGADGTAPPCPPGDWASSSALVEETRLCCTWAGNEARRWGQCLCVIC